MQTPGIQYSNFIVYSQMQYFAAQQKYGTTKNDYAHEMRVVRWMGSAFGFPAFVHSPVEDDSLQ